jgi:hypothetical protein
LPNKYNLYFPANIRMLPSRRWPGSSKITTALVEEIHFNARVKESLSLVRAKNLRRGKAHG